jgi:hypothetical protein
MRRGTKGKGGVGGRRGGAREGEAGPKRVERLQRSFARFRREHPSGTRIPDGLRKGALTAMDNGASEAEVRRACGVTSEQLAQWRNRQEGCRGSGGQERPVVAEPRMFPVVDDETVVGNNAEGLRELELRLGGWSICIRQEPPCCR